MATIGENLRRAILEADTGNQLGGRCEQNKISKDNATFPRAYFRRASHEDELCLDGSRGSYITDEFDVEIHDEDIDDALTLADSIRSTLHGTIGAFGIDGTAKAMRVDDQDDDYIPRGIGEDDGIHTAALRVRIIHAST